MRAISNGDTCFFGTARRAQARACLSTGARVTVVLLTFRVLAQGGGGTQLLHLYPTDVIFCILCKAFEGLQKPCRQTHGIPPTAQLPKNFSKVTVETQSKIAAHKCADKAFKSLLHCFEDCHRRTWA